MIRGVIFDLGNTLMYWLGEGTDIESTSYTALLKFLNQNGLHLTDEFLPLFKAARQDGWRLAEQTDVEHTVEEALATALRQQGDPNLNGILPRAVEEFFEAGATYRHSYPESIETLEALKNMGQKVGLISNADDDGLVQRCVVQLGFAPYMDPVTSSAGLKWRKPNPDIFRYVANLWQLPPGEIAMVGDAPRYDIAGARNAGMRGILIDRDEGHWWQKIPDDRLEDPAMRPDATIRSLLEIPDVISKW